MLANRVHDKLERPQFQHPEETLAAHRLIELTVGAMLVPRAHHLRALGVLPD